MNNKTLILKASDNCRKCGRVVWRRKGRYMTCLTCGEVVTDYAWHIAHPADVARRETACKLTPEQIAERRAERQAEDNLFGDYDRM